MIQENLSYNFPHSELAVTYSLCYCQGDGLNIYGVLNLFDFLEKWEATEKEKRTMNFYFENSQNQYTFEKNNHYCYSCKFIDKKYIDDAISEFIENLEYIQFKNINKKLIEKFYHDIIDYFQILDKEHEKAGYKYFYEVDENEVKEFCEANEYYFTERGKFIA